MARNEWTNMHPWNVTKDQEQAEVLSDLRLYMLSNTAWGFDVTLVQGSANVFLNAMSSFVQNRC